MDASGAVLRPPLCCPAAGIDVHPVKSATFVASSQSKALVSWGAIQRNFKVHRFWDNGHLQFYHSSPRCCRAGGKKQKEGCSSSSGVVKTKKKSKLLKGLEKDLSLFSGLDPSYGGVDQANAKIVAEAAETLLAQLRLLRAREKELKRMKKQEKKGTRVKENQGVDCEEDSSSSSSESSCDSEGCNEVVDMSRDLRIEAAPSSLSLPISAPPPISPNEQIAPKFEEKGCCCTNGNVSTSSVLSSTSTSLMTKRIEVCMGNKCKKAGAEALLQEFGTRVGLVGTVVGCKCMGKCRDAPNVRVFDAPSVSIAANNSLCIGVNPEDVDVILSSLLRDEQKVGQLATA